MERELRVSERLTLNVKITSTRNVWLDDSAKISCRELLAFYSMLISMVHMHCCYQGLSTCPKDLKPRHNNVNCSG